MYLLIRSGLEGCLFFNLSGIDDTWMIDIISFYNETPLRALWKPVNSIPTQFNDRPSDPSGLYMTGALIQLAVQ
jgi:hypothetical protein